MFDLQDFIGGCKHFVGAPDAAKRVLDLMLGVVGDAEAIKSAVVPGDPSQAIFDLALFRSSELLVLNATVPPHFATPPHDHGMWAVIGIYEGQENNTFYRRSGEGLEELNRREIRPGEAVLLGADVIHAIENPFGSNTLGLHVYGGDVLAEGRSMWHPSTQEELRYDYRQMARWCAELTKSRSAV